MERLISLLKAPVMVLLIVAVSYFLYSNVKLQDKVAKSWHQATEYSGIEKLQNSSEFLFGAEKKISNKLSSQQNVIFDLNKNRLLLEGKVAQGEARLQSLESTLKKQAVEYLALKEKVKGSEGNFKLTADLNDLVNSINRHRLEEENLLSSLKRSRDALRKNRDSLAIAQTTILQLEADLDNVRLTQSLADVFATEGGILSAAAASELNILMADVQLISDNLESNNYSYVSDYIIKKSIAAEDSFDQFIQKYQTSEQPGK